MSEADAVIEVAAQPSEDAPGHGAGHDAEPAAEAAPHRNGKVHSESRSPNERKRSSSRSSRSQSRSRSRSRSRRGRRRRSSSSSSSSSSRSRSRSRGRHSRKGRYERSRSRDRPRGGTSRGGGGGGYGGMPAYGGAAAALAYASMPRMTGGGASQPWRSGDWDCQQCRGHNFASRSRCFQCGSEKPPQSMGGSFTGGGHPHQMHGGGHNPPGWEAARASLIGSGGGGGGGGSLPANFKQGDWLCPQCSTHCFASRSACFRCGASKG